MTSIAVRRFKHGRSFMTRITNVVVIGCLITLGLLMPPSARSDTLTALTECSYRICDLDKYGSPSGAIPIGEDSLMFVSAKGVFAGSHSTQNWRRVMDATPIDEPPPYSICREEELDRVYSASGPWLVSGENGSQALLLETFCGQLYTIESSRGGRAVATRWAEHDGRVRFKSINVQGNTVLAGLGLSRGEKAIAILHADRRHYRKIFEYPPGLARRLDSVGWVDGLSYCIPALNPNDSTLWVAIPAYDYIYIIDFEGKMLDSVYIDEPYYRVPPPIKSRVKSTAVISDWLSEWTLITTFAYASPGYFLLRYSPNEDDPAWKDGLRVRSLAWDVHGNPVSLNIGHNSWLLGVHDDGRLVLRRRTKDNGEDGFLMTVVRLQP